MTLLLRPRSARLLAAAVAVTALSAAAVPAAQAQTTATASRLGLYTRPSIIYAGQSSNVVVTGDPGVYVLLFAYSAPSQDYRKVREGTMPADGSLELTVKPSTNSSLFAAVRGQTGNESIARKLTVRTALSLAAQRTGTRQYVFSGKILPAAQTLPVVLNRYNNDGTETLIAKGTSDSATGTYRIPRTFSGTGTFNFVVRVDASRTNGAGVSKVARITVN